LLRFGVASRRAKELEEKISVIRGYLAFALCAL
jgi:hypothetical protein